MTTRGGIFLRISKYVLANILISQKKIKEAEFSLRKTIKLKSNFAEAHLNLGIVLNAREEIKEAEVYIRKSIEINPSLFYSHFLLANILSSKKKLKEAESSYRKAIKFNPRFAIAYLNLGNILKDLGKSKEAFDYYFKASNLESNLPNLYAAEASLCSSLWSPSPAVYVVSGGWGFSLAEALCCEILPNFAAPFSKTKLLESSTKTHR